MADSSDPGKLPPPGDAERREPRPAPSPPDGPGLLERVRSAPVTFAITAINIAVFVAAERTGSTQKTSTLIHFGAVDPALVWAGEYWRVASYMFLHIGWMHLLWNTYASIGWSTSVEVRLGKARFLALYLLSGIGGGCACVIFQPSVTAGASGAMFGLVGATLAMRRYDLGSFKAFAADPSTRANLLNIVIWTVIGATALHMSHAAHFGGLAIGAAAAWLFLSADARAGWIAFAVVFVALFVNAIRPWWTPTGEQADRLASYAEAYMRGKDWPLDVARGERLAERGCNAGVARTCTVLGITLQQSTAPAEQSRGAALFRKACGLGDREGCAAEGYAVATGRGVPRDEAVGRAAVHDACTGGSTWACQLERDLKLEEPPP